MSFYTFVFVVFNHVVMLMFLPSGSRLWTSGNLNLLGCTQRLWPSSLLIGSRGGGIMPVSDWPSSVLRFLCVINSLISVSCLSLTFRRLCFSARSPLARSAPGKKFKVLHLFVQSLIYWVIQIFGRDICWKEEEWESQTDSVRSPMSRKVAFMKDVVTHEHDFDSKILICRPSRCTVVKRCCGRSRRDRKCRD